MSVSNNLEGLASTLADPEDRITFKNLRGTRNAVRYPSLSVPREDFIAHGQALQERFSSDIEERRVVAIRRSGDAFAMQLDDDEIVAVHKVVISMGISDFPKFPPSIGAVDPVAAGDFR
jgi:hypothetical protein